MSNQKRFEIVKNLINATFPDNAEDYHYTSNSKDFLLIIICSNGERVIKSFEVDSNWKHIKKLLKDQLKIRRLLIIIYV